VRVEGARLLIYRDKLFLAERHKLVGFLMASKIHLS